MLHLRHPFRKIIVLCAAVVLLAEVVCAWAADMNTVDVDNRVVFYDENTFAGWPANEGSWAWGNEVLVCFNTGPYEEKTDTHSHKSGVRLQTTFARSVDGGKTWAVEPHDELSAPPVPFEAGVDDMTAPGFAMKLRGNVFYVTKDKGHFWDGPYTLPSFESQRAWPNARTSYIVTGPKSALFFMTSRSERAGGKEGERGRAYVMRTQDGCKTFEFLGWMAPDLTAQASDKEKQAPIFSIMPSVVRIEGDHYVAAMRQRIDRRKWTDIFESTDGGKTWTFVSKAEGGSNNPPALLKLADGKTLMLLYGWRGRQPGMRARLSSNNGRTWSDEYVLRADARTWDIGYPRAHLMPDGNILALYYYTTAERRQQHIAATRWVSPIAAKGASNAP